MNQFSFTGYLPDCFRIIFRKSIRINPNLINKKLAYMCISGQGVRDRLERDVYRRPDLLHGHVLGRVEPILGSVRDRDRLRGLAGRAPRLLRNVRLQKPTLR